jgi:hypothetical protein
MHLLLKKQIICTPGNATPKSNVPFSADLILSHDKYQQLVVLQNTSHFQKQQIWTTHMIRHIWKIEPSLVDDDFYKTFIGQFFHKPKFRKPFDRIQRCAILLTKGRGDNVCLNDVWQLLQCLLPDEPFQLGFLEGKKFSLSKEVFEERVAKYVNCFDEVEFQALQKRHNIKYDQTEIMTNTHKVANPFIKNILKSCSLTCETSTVANNRRCLNFGTRVFFVRDEWNTIVSKYCLSALELAKDRCLLFDT